MPGTFRAQRVDALIASQNADGGWGYFAGKRSWLEPTAYGLLALYDQMNSPHWKRGWDLVRSWQLPDGSWRPNGQVSESHWSTALAVTLHCARKQFDAPFRRGVEWLLEQRGEESTTLARFLGIFMENHIGHDRKFAGWPWLPGTTSWIEPTSHALVALKRSAPEFGGSELRRRVTLAEGMILRRRCSDGGWNYGSRAALGIDLPSYPETTALALLGLQSCPEADLSKDLIRARELWQQCEARLGRAWLAVSLRNFGVDLPEDDKPIYRNDILATALEALSAPNGGHSLLRPGSLV
ncbi:MAG: terpene cyclase/mutase family protein [Acidobacteria bacterium]|nr:terpene cyclase/mutase family protein [Acidobacteriota bacterium]